mgnify:CR=1 FL=1
MFKIFSKKLIFREVLLSVFVTFSAIFQGNKFKVNKSNQLDIQRSCHIAEKWPELILGIEQRDQTSTKGI